MSRFHSYLINSKKLIETYKPGVPFYFHLKSFFQSQKKYGSRDRKIISSICYHYFRCYFLFRENDFSENQLLYAVFICESSKGNLLEALAPELNERVGMGIDEKLQHLKLHESELFGFCDELSECIDVSPFSRSFLTQPALFLRIRPGKKAIVIHSIEKAKIEFEAIGDSTLKLRNGINLDGVLKLDNQVIIQDFSSQHAMDFLLTTDFINKKEKIPVWDACAASGGKSILLYDVLKGNIKLTVSDIRKNILSNLQARLNDAGVNIYKKFEQNLVLASGLDSNEKYSIVLCDVPCSGSGTWSRTPEQHFSFDKNQIDEFVKKQKAIVSNALPHVEKNGLLIYMTCSIFKRENEDVVDFIKDNYAAKLLQMDYIKGYEMNADTMFVATFTL